MSLYQIEQRKPGTPRELGKWLDAKASTGARLVGVVPADRGCMFIFENPSAKPPALPPPAKPSE